MPIFRTNLEFSERVRVIELLQSKRERG